MSKRQTPFLALILFIVSLASLIVINIPASRIIYKLQVKETQSITYNLEIQIPERIWLGESERVSLFLSEDNLLNTTEPEKILRNLEVDFILTGAEINPPGILVTPIIPGKSINHNWMITPVLTPTSIGSIWVYLELNPLALKDNFQRKLIYTKDIQIEVFKIFGMSKSVFQWILSSIVLINFLLLCRSLKIMRTAGF